MDRRIDADFLRFAPERTTWQHRLLTTARVAGAQARRVSRALRKTLVSTHTWSGALLIAGVAMAVSAAYVLAGTGWALAAASGFAFLLATLLAKGA